MDEDDVIILCVCLTAVVLNVIFYGYLFVRIIMPFIITYGNFSFPFMPVDM